MEPIKFLVITSRPLINDKEEPLRLVNVTEARHRLRTGLEQAQIPVQVRFVPQACTDIVQMCAQDDFDVLHYFGHGATDGSLCFEDERGMVHSVDPTSFVQVLRLNRSPKPRLAVISACHSEYIAAKIYDLNIPAIAVKGEKPIHERAAILFNQLLFHSWVRGKTLNEAYDEGVNAVRNDAEVGDDAYRNNPLYADDPTPFSDRFVILASTEQRRSRLFKAEAKAIKTDYKEKHVETLSNVPPPTPNFMGREKQIHELLQHIHQKKITAITGAAGLGKTELAKAVGQYLAERNLYDEGIFWASAREDEMDYPLRGLESLLNIILGVKTGQAVETAPYEQKLKLVKELLASGRALIILDNYETVQKDDKLWNFLINLPTPARVLIASRRELPAHLVQNYKPGLLEIEIGAALFLLILEQAGYFQRYDTNVEKEAHLVEKICNALQGHPLALIITAGRTQTQTIEQIWQQLKSTPKKVLQGKDTRTDKEAGVWTAVDMSYNDLDEQQKQLLAELSIFFCPVGEEAIEAVLRLRNVADMLDTLQRRSLIERYQQAYHFLPIIKMYAHDQLKHSKTDLRPIHQRAAEYFKNKRDQTIAHTIDHLDVLGREYNDRKAWGELIKFMLTIEQPLFRAGLWDVDEEKLLKSLSAAKALKDRKNEAALLNHLGALNREKGRFEQAMKYHRQSLEICTDLKDEEGQANQWCNIGCVYTMLERLDEALKVYKKALKIGGKVGDLQGQADTWGNIGVTYKEQGRLDEALEAYRKGLKIQEELGKLPGQAAKWGNIGIVYRMQGRFDEALKAQQKALEIDEKENNINGQAGDLCNIGQAYEAMGDIKTAISYTEKALKIFTDLGALPSAQIAAHNLQRLHQKLQKG